MFWSGRFLKVVNVLFANLLLSTIGKSVALHLNKLKFPSSKDALCHVWFWRIRFSIVVNIFLQFSFYLPLWKGVAIFFYQTWISFIQRCSVSSLVKIIGPVVVEKTIFKCCQHTLLFLYLDHEALTCKFLNMHHFWFSTVTVKTFDVTVQWVKINLLRMSPKTYDWNSNFKVNFHSTCFMIWTEKKRKRVWPFIWTNLNPLVVLEKKMKIWKVYRWTDRWRDEWQVIRKAFCSGKLKMKIIIRNKSYTHKV